MNGPIRILPSSLIGRLLLWAAVLFAVSIPVFYLVFDAAVSRVSRDVVDNRLLEFADQVRAYRASIELPLEEGDGLGPEGLDVETGTQPNDTSAPGGTDIDWVWQYGTEAGSMEVSPLLRFTGTELIPLDRTLDPQFTIRYSETPLGAMRLAERTVNEPEPDGGIIKVTYIVGLPEARYEGYVSDNEARLRPLAILGVIPVSIGILGFLAVMVLTTRRTLERLDAALNRYEEGETAEIEGTFPTEIRRVILRLNGVLAQNRKLIERTRKYVGKIAHDINHPLAIMKNALKSEPDRDLLNRQIERMTGLVDRYASLARALGPESEGAALRIEIAPVLNDIADGFTILYRRTPVSIECECAEALTFPIPRHDLETMVSNLVSNAHKHAETKILIRAEGVDSALLLTVEDDGPGIPEDKRANALNWGKRLDEAPPGTGFGLSIVQDIADLYDGRLSLGESALGGLAAKLYLPPTISSV